MKISNAKIIFAAIIAGSTWSMSLYASNVGNLTTFTSGTPAVASEVNGNFSTLTTAVNDNDTRLTAVEVRSITNEGKINALTTTVENLDTKVTQVTSTASDNDSRIAANEADIQALQAAATLNPIFTTSVTYRVPVNDKTVGNTTVNVLLVNTTSTDCIIFIAKSFSEWAIGANEKSNVQISPTWLDKSLPGIDAVNISDTVTTLVALENVKADLSAYDYVDVTLTRDETVVTDSCGPTDITVKGAAVVYPNSSKYFVPVSEMVVQ